MATYTLLNNVLSSLDRRNFIGVLFCDLRVHHEILLAKMKFYGISGITNKLMRSYLENRYQRISMKDSKPNELSSKWVHVKHGVPQGSVLGPLLFLIQGDSGGICITLGSDSMSDSNQKSSYEHGSDFERLRSYGHFLIPVHALV